MLIDTKDNLTIIRQVPPDQRTAVTEAGAVWDAKRLAYTAPRKDLAKFKAIQAGLTTLDVTAVAKFAPPPVKVEVDAAAKIAAAVEGLTPGAQLRILTDRICYDLPTSMHPTYLASFGLAQVGSVVEYIEPRYIAHFDAVYLVVKRELNPFLIPSAREAYEVVGVPPVKVQSDEPITPTVAIPAGTMMQVQQNIRVWTLDPLTRTPSAAGFALADYRIVWMRDSFTDPNLPTHQDYVVVALIDGEEIVVPRSNVVQAPVFNLSAVTIYKQVVWKADNRHDQEQLLSWLVCMVRDGVWDGFQPLHIHGSIGSLMTTRDRNGADPKQWNRHSHDFEIVPSVDQEYVSRLLAGAEKSLPYKTPMRALYDTPAYIVPHTDVYSTPLIPVPFVSDLPEGAIVTVQCVRYAPETDGLYAVVHREGFPVPASFMVRLGALEKVEAQPVVETPILPDVRDDDMIAEFVDFVGGVVQADTEPFEPSKERIPGTALKKLENWIVSLDKDIAHMLRPFGDNAPTRKRMDEYNSRMTQGRKLRLLRSRLAAYIEQQKAGTVADVIARLATKTTIEWLHDRADYPQATPLGQTALNNFVKEGVTAERYAEARAAWLALGDPKAGDETDAEKLDRLQKEILMRSPDGYFPTPPELVTQLLDCLMFDIEPERVLEPSAGTGHIARELRERFPDAVLHVVEAAPACREILRLQGFEMVDSDFTTFTPDEPYDVIVMNPPFEKGQDMEHVRRAYGMLAPGGGLAAVMSNGWRYRKDKQATAFREWLEALDYEVRDVPAGAFKTSGTGVSATMVWIQKPSSDDAPLTKKPLPIPVEMPSGTPVPSLSVSEIDAQIAQIASEVETAVKALNQIAPPKQGEIVAHMVKRGNKPVRRQYRKVMAAPSTFDNPGVWEYHDEVLNEWRTVVSLATRQRLVTGEHPDGADAPIPPVPPYSTGDVIWFYERVGERAILTEYRREATHADQLWGNWSYRDGDAGEWRKNENVEFCKALDKGETLADLVTLPPPSVLDTSFDPLDDHHEIEREPESPTGETAKIDHWQIGQKVRVEGKEHIGTIRAIGDDDPRKDYAGKLLVYFDRADGGKGTSHHYSTAICTLVTTDTQPAPIAQETPAAAPLTAFQQKALDDLNVYIETGESARYGKYLYDEGWAIIPLLNSGVSMTVLRALEAAGHIVLLSQNTAKFRMADGRTPREVPPSTAFRPGGHHVLTPLRQQYLEIKQGYPDAILVFRLGDFYETFDDDAKIASEVCNLVLTSRPVSKSERVPMAGFPVHAKEQYIAMLVKAGHRVAVCEQTTEPKGIGLVERKVVDVREAVTA